MQGTLIPYDEGQRDSPGHPKYPLGHRQTVLHIGVGLEKITNPDQREYRKFPVRRSNFQFNHGKGSLPGRKQENSFL